MKDILKIDIKVILIVILVIIILLMKACSGNSVVGPDGKPIQTVKVDGKVYDVIKHTTDTQYVPKYTIISKKGDDIYHDTTIYVPIPTDKPIDTMGILRDFYAKNVFKDTLKLGDSLGTVSIIDTITKNKILKRDFIAKVREKIIKDTFFLKDPLKRQLYGGGGLGIDKTNGLNNVNGGFLYKDKKENIYQIGLGISNNSNALTPFLFGGIYWKIRLKKDK